MVGVPRLVIAAPSSGSGKTTVACGLMAALRATGLVVSGHKVGPDYIDPGYHSLATGRPARNLDPVLCGQARIGPLFAHGAEGAHVAVIEGVMGLFDGATAPSGEGAGDPAFGSTAHVARLLAAPVILVVDASATGRSVAALVTGFDRFDPATEVAGVIFNQVGSDRHEALLRDALAATGIPVYGAIRRSDQVSAPSRHLGLIPVAERSAAATEVTSRLGALIAQSCDLPGLLALARSAPALAAPAWDPATEVPSVAGPARPVVAVAGGAAFTFSYTEHSELLAAAGLDVVTFDPLRDEQLPAGTAGLVLGGGFPELHASGLSANEPLRRAVAAAAARGVPVAAECAGLLYLARTLDGAPMCNVLPVDAAMTAQLTLGYREPAAATDSILAPAGTTVRAHEFHRTTTDPQSGSPPAWFLPTPSTSASGTPSITPITPARQEGHATRNVHASYLHVHWAGYPQCAARFAAACHAAAPAEARS
ncbi:MAG TPA: cobyrinate a,c-diamide synthase [Streptosporangiaceae bacterium]|nr:cobyrinate a,c-diamide synthase [Streptosporangiaceae bacterium]